MRARAVRDDGVAVLCMGMDHVAWVCKHWLGRGDTRHRSSDVAIGGRHDAAGAWRGWCGGRREEET